MSIRQYANALFINQATNGRVESADATDAIINQAEELVDAYIYNEFGTSLGPYRIQEIFDQCNFTNTTCTLPSAGYSKDEFSYCVIEILSGSLAGALIPVKSSNDNILSEILEELDQE
jgi:hypothetical protein